ncbi:MAG: hypothetical protein ACRD6X_18950, partial [Pyrinomonadaceae bacterium]
FTTRIKHGMIHLPKDHEELENSVAHVVVIVQTNVEENRAKKERLLAAFKEAQKADIFRKIDDPVEWQRKLRDEWE